MKTTWTTKEGVKLEISEMETSHIRNCIKMLTAKMPDHEEDEVICADFPESMDWHPNCYTESGAKSYREKITQFTQELVKRKEI